VCSSDLSQQTGREAAAVRGLIVEAINRVDGLFAATRSGT